MDITDRMRADIWMKRVNPLSKMLSEINAHILHVREHGELFAGSSRSAVETGGFQMVILGIVDRATNKVVAVASAGLNGELPTAAEKLWCSREKTSTALVSKASRDKTVIVSNGLDDDSMALLGENQQPSRLHSLAIRRLVVSD